MYRRDCAGLASANAGPASNKLDKGPTNNNNGGAQKA